MSDDVNYECLGCGAGRQQCGTNHCDTCDGDEYTDDCAHNNHEHCPGDRVGCSADAVVFRVRPIQPLLDSDSTIAIQATQHAVTPTYFRGEYDGCNQIEPAYDTLKRWPGIGEGRQRRIHFLLGDRYDNEPDDSLVEYGPKVNEEAYVLVDVWCQPCFRDFMVKQLNPNNSKNNTNGSSATGSCSDTQS